MNRTLNTIGGVLILFTSGCAALERSTLLGASIGAAGGTGIGLAVEQSVGSALIGTAIGGFVGAAFGYLTHKENERKDLLSKVGTRRKPLSEEIPAMKAPEANCITIGERVEGNRYVGPHIMCTIEKPAVWSR